MTLLYLCDSTAKLYYMLCQIKYTKPCWVCAVRDGVEYNITVIVILGPAYTWVFQEWRRQNEVGVMRSSARQKKNQVCCLKPKSKSKCWHFLHVFV